MKKYFLMMLLIGQLAFTTKIYSQNIAINGTGSLPDTSAMLDVSSTIKGFLAPRMNTTQQNSIILPANGLLIYNTQDNEFKVNTGTPANAIWTDLAMGNAGTVNSFTAGGLSPLFSTGVATPGTTPALTFTASTVPAYTFLGRASGTGTYSFISGMDSLWIPALHSQTYYDLRYNRLLVSGTSIKTVNNTSLLGSGNLPVEPVITAPNNTLKYWTGYKTYGSFYDSARKAITLTTTGTGPATYSNLTGVLNIPTSAETDGTVTSIGITSSDITVGGTSPVTGSGIITLALPAVNNNVGTFTNASITVNAKGLITAASSGIGGGSGGIGGWGLTGNQGTNPSNNYMGTNDAQPLIFKAGGSQAGYLGTNSTSTISFGVGSSAAPSTQSTAIGALANANNNEATAVGYNASAGYQGISIGSGAKSLGNNEVIAIGHNSNASSSQGIAIGALAVVNNGNENIAVGYNASAVGSQSVAIGSGAKAYAYNETIAIGRSSSANSYKGIAIGSGAATSSGDNSLAIGVGANATGYQSTAIGTSSKATAQNATAIGNGASESNSNYIAIGNTSVTAIRGQVNFTTYSDGRFKRNIQADVPGLDFILKLRPVTYNWDIHKFNEHSLGNEIKATQVKYSAQNALEEAAILKKESITYTGFIAQEVEKAAGICKFNFSGVLKPVNDKDAYSLSYAEFVVPLVKATQELNDKNEALNNKIDIQQKMIEQLIEEVKELKKAHK